MFGTHILHTVEPGDTVYRLAGRYDSTVAAITRANALYPPFVEPYQMYPNQVLIIPKTISGETVTLYVVQRGGDDLEGGSAFLYDTRSFSGN
nr:LysM peptidoglycan-binding domain-containing protein [Halalkalibacter krulwichiae]